MYWIFFIKFEAMIDFLRFICMVMKGIAMNNFKIACLNEKKNLLNVSLYTKG